MGIAVATVGAGKIVSKLASKGSKIMQRHHRPLMTKPDAMPAVPNADEGLSQCAAPELVRETTYKLGDVPYVNNRTLTDKNVTRFTREFKGYTDRKFDQDSFHNFPYSYDMEIVQHGTALSTKINTGYIYHGFVNNKPGFYNITIDNATEKIFHRQFWEYKDRFQIYVLDENGNKRHFLHINE